MKCKAKTSQDLARGGRVLTAVLAIALSAPLFLTGCDTTFENPNAASEDQVTSTVEGLRALAIGIRREYSVTTLSAVVRSSGLSAREFAVVVGFTNPQEIEAGGTALPSENGILTGLWSSNYRVIGMAENLVDNVGIIGDVPSQNAYRALAHFYKALALGNVAMFYEQSPITADPSGQGPFLGRTEVLNEAISLLEQGISALGTDAPPADFQNAVLGTDDFNLWQSMNALLARYRLFVGDNTGAITAADAALTNPGSISVWTYETGNGNENPLYLQTTEEPATYKPIDNFGIDPAEFVVPAGDGRLAFYLEAADGPEDIGESSRIPIDVMHGFYDAVDKAIPVYLPGEMNLIKAEAFARDSDVTSAITSLDAVLQKTNDAFGVNAGFATGYAGPATQEAVLTQIYYNRRIELFLIGTSLEDSRRFGRAEPPSPPSFESFDRNRNFYPYPQTERDNNTNTPADPVI